MLATTASDRHLELKDITTHNLKNISVSIPLGSLTAVSGVSGSGKSSLVFHTIHAHSYRRYVDSLSSYARQFLKSFPKPQVDTTVNLQPSIAVRQSGGGLGARSSVGSLTEIDDLIRAIFAARSGLVCPEHGPLPWFDVPKIVEHITDNAPPDSSVLICAPLEHLIDSLLRISSESADPEEAKSATRGKKKTAAGKKRGAGKLEKKSCRLNAVRSALEAMLREQGLVRLRSLDGEVYRISGDKDSHNDSGDEGGADAGRSLEGASVVIDRVKVSDHERLVEALKKSLVFSSQHVSVVSHGGDPKNAFDQRYRLGYYCTKCGYHGPQPQPEFFKATHPKGACPTCQGYGRMMIWDWERILAKASGSDAPSLTTPLDLFKGPGGAAAFQKLRERCEEYGISARKPFSEYSKKELKYLKWGEGSEIDEVDLPPGTLDEKSGFLGIRGFLLSLKKRSSGNTRFLLSRYRTYKVCTTCYGEKLNALSRQYYLGGRSFPQVLAMNVTQLNAWLEEVQKGEESFNATAGEGQRDQALEEVYLESAQRLGYLEEIGLSYLSLSREGRTLSGGELQRIHMARCLGSALTSTLYCLDEPTVGLHPLDTRRLLGVMTKLRDQGNTVVVVEHDPQTLRGCDYLLRLGPSAGVGGGELCYEGSPQDCPELKENAERWTQSVEELAKNVRSGSRAAASAGRNNKSHSKNMITLSGVRTHNLDVPEVSFPKGAVIGVCGVSGSGKTSLIRHSLYPALCDALDQVQKHDTPAADYDGISGDLSDIDSVSLVSQEALGRSSRANIATYLGVAAPLRNILASSPGAKQHNLTSSSFSFNTPGGRCEVCMGLGTVTEDLSFLGEMSVRCPSCLGKRFLPSVLSVRYQGKNIDEILNMTVREAYEFFQHDGTIRHVLSEVLDLGLGYLTLSQSTRSFSGGEAQRLKILRLLTQRKEYDGSQVLIFDEPTGGLAEEDVQFLWRKFQKLKEAGHTIVIVEHHLGLLYSVDWLIEVGPGSSDAGGRVIHEGPPQKLKGKEISRIAPFFAEGGI